ncbi:MAG: preprotein translocase subunit SecE [Mollicutes bacterium]|jgi:preprotein translocase subunit SecE|nr:preprotein translocase subunit SecE [Mollicutes bacterium]
MKKIIEFLKDVKKEMKKVRWPNKKEMATYSIATISFIIFFALFFMIIDIVLATLKTWVR